MTQAADEISLFVRVVERGSFAAVADETGLTPSGVSKAISRLEDRLGVKLLQRTTRQLVLTAEGDIYLQRGRDILAAIEAAEAEVSASRGRPKGLIRVNTGTALGKHRIAALLPDFLDRYPEIKLDLSLNDHRIDVIAEQVDVVIRTGPLGDSALVARRISAFSRHICASPAYLARHGTPRTPQDLLQHNCMLITGHSRLSQWPFLINGEAVSLDIKGNFVSNNADFLLDMAEAGVGIIRFADFLLDRSIREGRLVRLLEGYYRSDDSVITALMPPGRQNLPRVRVFLDYLQEKLG